MEPPSAKNTGMTELIEGKQEAEQCVKGVHWGKYEFEEEAFSLTYDQREVFNIPYKKITNSNCTDT